MKFLTLFVLTSAFISGANAHALMECAGNLPAPICLPGPPQSGSPEERSDYEQLLILQNSRTDAECARAVSEQPVRIQNFFGPPYGPLTQSEVTKAVSAFDRAGLFAGPMIGLAKGAWRRPRPYVTHTDLRPCVKLESSFSYPSGHSALAQFYMHLLAELFPTKAIQLRDRASQIAFDRTLGGVHYPSDVRDGKLLGDQIYQAYRSQSRF